MKSSDDTTSSPPSPMPSLLQTDYAKDTYKLTDVVDQLRSIGVQHELHLPRIAVIGNQSAGKSSLVEAISEISVPRDSGTCTRCPMECRLRPSKSAHWSCQISIRRKGVANTDMPEVNFGDCIVHKADVEKMIRRAQLAVLDQKTPMSHFLDMEDDVLETMMNSNTLPRFSSDVVCLHITGPDLPNLSFIDLPGIIHNADLATIQLVENLVKSYLGDNSLILVALTMSDDIENQSAARLARDADPTGSRTIGVLTKPDTIDPGSSAYEKWLDIIEGRCHILTHGYYCVRQPNDVERKKGFTPSEARSIEAEFFKHTKPWSMSSHRDRFGTHNLGKTMSKLLIEMTRRSLPTMKKEILSQIRLCDRDILTMPPLVTSDPVIFVMNMVTTFVSTLVEHVRGSTTKAVFVQQNNALYANLHVAIGLTAPIFSPYNDCAPLGTRFTPQGNTSQGFQQARGQVMGLDYIRAHIAASITRELPHHVPYAARESLIRAFQETWQQDITECFEAVKQEFSQLLQEIVHLHFGRFAALKAAVRSIIADFLTVRAEKALDTIEYHLFSERTLLYTQNREYLAAQRAKYLAGYSNVQQPFATPPAASKEQHSKPPTTNMFDFRQTDLGGGSQPNPTQAPIFSTASAGPSRATTSAGPSGTASASSPSNTGALQHELELMADVRAYFDIAHQRILDDVQRAIDLKFLYGFCDELQDVLLEKLRLGAPDAKAQCITYLAEDPSDAAKREALLSQKRKFENAMKTLNAFGL